MYHFLKKSESSKGIGNFCLLDDVRGCCYVLIIQVKTPIIIKTRSKEFEVEKGNYVYCGSAKRAILSRLKRHLSNTKKNFWHIDFLLTSGAKIKEIWTFSGITECEIAKTAIKLGMRPIFGFGSSDCKKCPAHLFESSKIVLNNFFSALAHFKNASLSKVFG